MHYVCIENNVVTAILNYEPNVPGTVSVVRITDTEAQQINNQTHVFDAVSRTVKPIDASVTAQKAKDLANADKLEFLRSTDWQILRHIRQKALGQPTSLTDAEYIALEQQRATAAAGVV